jgi:hypothetical protein
MPSPSLYLCHHYRKAYKVAPRESAMRSPRCLTLRLKLEEGEKAKVVWQRLVSESLPERVVLEQVQTGACRQELWLRGIEVAKVRIGATYGQR